jgi:hypothetical protein
MAGMKERPRVYDRILEAHLRENRQMAFGLASIKWTPI